MVLKGFSVSSWIWSADFRSNDFEAFRKASKFGFDALEIPTMDGIFDTVQIREVLNSTSPYLTPIIIGGGLPHTDLTSESVPIAENGTAYIKRCIKVCANIGGSLVCGPLYSAVGSLRYLSVVERDNILKRLIHSFKEISKYAQDFGVFIALEPLCRYDTHLLNTSMQARDLIEKIGKENIGILLDTFHMNIEEKSIKDAISITGRKLVHFHACENDRGTPGTGKINWDEVSESLTRVGYDGWISIESFTPFDKDFATAMKVWRNLENTQDEIATKGLAFLKTKF
jgi:D-psicose/D-tagatose/L-ribulose 3-epimerase